MSPQREDEDRREYPAAEVVGVVATASGVYPLHADGTVEEQDPATVIAVIYDRLATPSRALLEMRLHACRSYAAERGWRVAAEHVDTGEEALRDRSRPGLESAVADVRDAMEEPAAGRAVLLVYNDGRLSHDAMNLASWRYLVGIAGGTVATIEQPDGMAHSIAVQRSESSR